MTKSTAMTNIFTLRNYSLAAGAFLISVAPMGGDSSTDISYTDLDPDISLDPNLVGPDEIDIETYQIDLNGDSINDVSFSARFNNFITSWYFVPVMENEIMAKPLGNVELGIDTDPIPGTLPNWEYPNAYNMGDMLDDGLNWCGSGAGCVDAYFQGLVCEYDLDDFDSRGADWLGAQFKYIAIRVENAGNKYYGWIRLSIDKKADKVVIHDYAISNEPNTPIIAGDRGNCAPPSVNSGAGIGTTTAKVKWAPVFEAISYKLRYRIAGTGSWNYQTIPGAAHFKTLQGLPAIRSTNGKLQYCAPTVQNPHIPACTRLPLQVAKWRRMITALQKLLFIPTRQQIYLSSKVSRRCPPKCRYQTSAVCCITIKLSKTIHPWRSIYPTGTWELTS